MSVLLALAKGRRGHPLHPPFTDATIGACTVASARIEKTSERLPMRSSTFMTPSFRVTRPHVPNQASGRTRTSTDTWRATCLQTGLIFTLV